MISGRRPKGQELLAFYHEFETKHVNLMRQARCERFIKRYTQNKVIKNIPAIELWAETDMNFDSQASLLFEDLESMSNLFSDPDYNQIVKSHAFTDSDYMTVELSEESTMIQGKNEENLVKLIYYLKPQHTISRQEFRKFIDKEYEELAISNKRELLVSHRRSHCFPETETRFMSAAFPTSQVSQYGAIEELWFKNLEDMRYFHQGSKAKIHQNLSNGINFDESYSLVVTDKIVFES